ncbi:MAG: PAS domain S-box protein [Saprospiraceae bacterium]
MSDKHYEDSLRLKAVFTAVIDGIITMDESGIIDMINPAAAHLFGYEPEEVIGQNVKMLMPSPYRAEHDGYIKKYLDTGQRQIIGIGREVRGKKKDGTIFPMRLSVGEVKMEAGRRIFTGIVHDMTAIKKAQSQVLALNEKLAGKNEELEEKVRLRTAELDAAVVSLETALGKEKELSELKSRFVSMASHEFKTPLATILSSIELIEAYKADTQLVKREKHIMRVKSAVDYLNSVLQDFLSLSRFEEGKVMMNPITFELNSFLKKIHDDIVLMLKKGQKIQFELLEEDYEVNLDPKFLKHILFNLLSNSIKYSAENSILGFKIQVIDNQLFIKIKDAGIGIPKEDQKHLFTRFFRAHNVENIKGTGLGLSIVKLYVDEMKGRIEFDSKEGVGTEFRIWIPLIELN